MSDTTNRSEIERPRLLDGPSALRHNVLENKQVKQVRRGSEMPEKWVPDEQWSPEIGTQLPTELIYLSLKALDTMVQMILAQDQLRREKEDDRVDPGNDRPNLVDAAGQTPTSTEQPPLLSEPQADRRDCS